MEVEVLGGTIKGLEPFLEEVVPPKNTTNNDAANPKIEVLWAQTCSSPDALTAVKLDPAVLEAQVTLESEKSVPADLDRTDSPAPKSKESASDASSCTTGFLREDFERMVDSARATLQSLPPHQLHLLMSYVSMLRRQRAALQRSLECAFCKNNGEPMSWYSSHALKDWRGRVLCPVLRAFRCPRCGATGDRAHTIKYCPEYLEADLARLEATFTEALDFNDN